MLSWNNCTYVTSGSSSLCTVDRIASHWSDCTSNPVLPFKWVGVSMVCKLQIKISNRIRFLYRLYIVTQIPVCDIVSYSIHNCSYCSIKMYMLLSPTPYSLAYYYEKSLHCLEPSILTSCVAGCSWYERCVQLCLCLAHLRLNWTFWALSHQQ